MKDQGLFIVKSANEWMEQAKQLRIREKPIIKIVEQIRKFTERNSCLSRIERMTTNPQGLHDCIFYVRDGDFFMFYDKPISNRTIAYMIGNGIMYHKGNRPHQGRLLKYWKINMEKYIEICDPDEYQTTV